METPAPMHFLRTLFWIAVAIAAVLLSANNWTPITVNLSSSLRMDTRLPVLVIGAFLAGLLPMLIAYHAARWRWRRTMVLPVATATMADSVDGLPEPSLRRVPPPAAVPIAVPPGVA